MSRYTLSLWHRVIGALACVLLVAGFAGGHGCAPQRLEAPTVADRSTDTSVAVNDITLQPKLGVWVPHWEGAEMTALPKVASVTKTYTPPFSGKGEIGRNLYQSGSWKSLSKDAANQVYRAIATGTRSPVSAATSFSPDLAFALASSKGNRTIYLLVDTSARIVGTLPANTLEIPKAAFTLPKATIDEIVAAGKKVALRQTFAARIYLCGCAECARVIKELKPDRSWNASVIYKGSEGDAALYAKEKGIGCPVIADGDGSVTQAAGVDLCPVIDLVTQRGESKRFGTPRKIDAAAIAEIKGAFKS